MTKTIVISVFVIALSAFARPASAQVDVLMLVPGVPGGSTNASHAGWIDVLSIQQDLTADRKSTACSLKVVKPLDIAGPRLWLAAVTGHVYPEVRIEFTRRSDQMKFYEIRLTNALVTGISDSGAGGGAGAISETVTWAAASTMLTFFDQNPDGSPGSQVTATVACN